VRSDATLGAVSGGSSFSSHTFCEVFVGGRWRRLNYNTLGQNVLERNYLGLMVHTHTFRDLSEANLAATWGRRYAKGERNDAFPHSNPYRLLQVSDHFGQFADVANPPADIEHKTITIGKAYWPEAPDADPAVVKLESGAAEGGHRFFIHGEEWFENAGDYLQYKRFMSRADKNLVLRAKGKPDVSCRVSMNFYTRSSQNLRELEVVIPPAEYAKMDKGVSYELVPNNSKAGYAWNVREGLALIRN
jgi:hypothetical protein